MFRLWPNSQLAIETALDVCTSRFFASSGHDRRRIIQDYVSVVLFDNTSFTAIDSNPIAETLVDLSLPHLTGAEQLTHLG